VLPDGPLHELPFAALRVPGDPKRYLAEWKPVHVASSFSLYAALAAGARSVLASLWSVSDESTELLMAEFYRNLKRGDSKDRALQEAQVAMIRRGARPFHWAAFQLTGDWR
jgi:CHAT domain-containing protein